MEHIPTNDFLDDALQIPFQRSLFPVTLRCLIKQIILRIHPAAEEEVNHQHYPDC